MSFSINTSLGAVIPHDFGQENGVFPIAECPVFDDINDGQGNRDWSLTEVIAEVSTKQYTFSFKQGRSLGVRYGLMSRDGLDTEHNINAYYAPSYIGFCAGYTDATQTEATLYFVWTAPVSGEEQALGYMQNYSGADSSRIYGFTIGTYKQADFPEEWDETPTEDEDNPNNTEPRGGEYADLGSFYENDLMPESQLPDPNANEIDYGGFVTCYCINSYNSGEFAEWGECLFYTSFWQSLKNKFEGLTDPLAMILDCTQLPLDPWKLNVDIADEVQLGGIYVLKPNGDSLISRIFKQRYERYSLGSVTIKEVWGSARDYSDTSVSLYLPYVGVKEVDADIVINATCSLYVYLDKWNGDLLYMLHVSNAGNEKKYYRQESVIYRWAGNCGKKIPIGRVDTSNQIMQMVTGLGSIGAGIAAGGAAGGLAQALQFGTNIATSGFRPTVQSSGGVSGSVGQMDYQIAYFIIKRGVPEYPNNWRAEIGAPQYQMYNVSNLIGNGFTLFSNIQLGDMGDAIEEEKAELERLLTTEGVIL